VRDDQLELDLERLCYPYRNLSDNGLHHLDYAVGASTQREGLERSIERERRFATSHGRVEGYARRERPKRCARRRTVSSVNAEKARQIRTEERGPFDKPDRSSQWENL